MIILSHDTAAVRLDVDREAICVRHPSYAAPQTGPGCAHMSWEAFAAAPDRALAGRSVMVVVGLNRIITPGNRTTVGPLVLRPRQGLRRISVDHTLFVSEPWRAWFHFGCVGAPYREYTYSYLAETHWRAAQDEVRDDDPFSAGAIIEAGRGVIRSLDARYFEPLEIQRVRVGADVHARYQIEKRRAFDAEHTPHRIITRLARIAADACPARRIPTPRRLFDARRHRIVQTDLKVDDYLVGQLRALVETTNAVAEAFHHG
ncbi:MAG TPA: hypothetical protein VF158_15935 [Longimicrobiales bacterium]